MPSRRRKRAWDIKHSRYTVVYDACVLYPAPVRDLLLEMAAASLFRAKWSNEIHDEWMRNLLAKRSDLLTQKLEKTRELMDAAVLDCLVEGHMDLVGSLELPDPDDRHVLAAAIHCGADAIVTFNLRDFPPDIASKYQIEVLHPDDFVRFQFDFDNARVIVAAERVRARLKNPEISAEEYLDILARQGLTKTAAVLHPFRPII
ncbi:putative toxin-antitoxin system toxin component, PIN family [Pelagerythrobacter sp.]|uniref:PIN domain-containing protein n=1 Tax=Pelagerythrobacter sp. TaxID=2800702 RepID=UPI0035B388F2